MPRNVIVILVAVLVVALPFLCRRESRVSDWQEGDPRLVIITPHNEAIRYEFARGFSEWHQRMHGAPARVEWRVVGGTTEIMRYLAGEYAEAFRGWWRRQGRAWPRGGGSVMLDRRFDARQPPDDSAGDAEAINRWKVRKEIHEAFRTVDDSGAFTCKVDLFFGGGTYDHSKAAAQGLTVEPWAGGAPPAGIVEDASGAMLIPEGLSGETWRSSHFYGTALSTFGICYNFDRLKDLGIEGAPERWDDLADPRYFRTLGVVDPTKSGSIAKAFEMIIQQKCRQSVAAVGFIREKIDAYEKDLSRHGGGDVPPAYHAAVEAGWHDGLHLVQLICANARYMTDAAGRVPQDVAAGNAAAGVCIDFYGRYQAEINKGPNGEMRMAYVTPSGGSSVSADPVSLLRGAEHRELALRFITYVLSADGQKLWNYRVDAPGGPARYALRRLPIRREFYPSENPVFHARYAVHRQYCVDPLGDASVNSYELAGKFEYRPRWTAHLFSTHRDLVRTMCLDAGDELKAAWEAIIQHGGPSAQPEAMAALRRLPDRPQPLTWEYAARIGKQVDRLDYMREWTLCFRRNYREARELAVSERRSSEKEPRSQGAHQPNLETVVLRRCEQEVSADRNRSEPSSALVSSSAIVLAPNGGGPPSPRRFRTRPRQGRSAP